MGLGTGLNAFLTAIEAEKHQQKIFHTAVERFPLSIVEALKLNYPDILGQESLFRKIHESNWEEDVMISPSFAIRKEMTDLIHYSTDQTFNLIYYDAFAPQAQPQLWTEQMFKKLFHMLAPAGVLVTYCSKGDVRTAMTAAGFDVKKLPGPAGKREMSRAVKI